MITIPFYAASPALGPVYAAVQLSQSVIKAETVGWSYPSSALRVEIVLPSSKIRIFPRAARTVDRYYGQIVSAGGGKVLYLPDPDHPAAQLRGATRLAIADMEEVSFNDDLVVASPSEDWIIQWVYGQGDRTFKKRDAGHRKDMIEQAGGTFVVRDVVMSGNVQYALLTYLHYFNSPFQADMVRATSIFLPHSFSSLTLLSGPDPTTTFSLNNALMPLRRTYS